MLRRARFSIERGQPAAVASAGLQDFRLPQLPFHSSPQCDKKLLRKVAAASACHAAQVTRRYASTRMED
jgi:hypothetical protein